MVSGRLVAESSRVKAVFAIVGLSLLALLPDMDVIGCALGVPDAGLTGHRGLTHTPAFALAVSLAAGLCARLWRKDAWRVGLTVALVVGSHGLLDSMAQDGRGIMTFWPLSTSRYHLFWRPIPDAPTGLAFLSHKGLISFLTELVYFAPFTLYALAPRARRLRRRVHIFVARLSIARGWRRPVAWRLGR
jgi:inner membrane protein